MGPDAIDCWPGGERPTYFATPGAWVVLRLLDRQGLKPIEKLRLLESHSTRDLRGAYFLTRDLGELRRREVLVSGGDAGRAERIGARNLLRRAFNHARMQEEERQLEADAAASLSGIRAAPPARLGHRQKSIRQVLDLACAAQPLSARLRLLLEVRPIDLEAGAARIRALPPGRHIHGRWPGSHERRQILRLLELAGAFLQDLQGSQDMGPR